MVRLVFYVLLGLVGIASTQAQIKYFPTGLVLCAYERTELGNWPDSIGRFVVKTDVEDETKASLLNNKVPGNWKIIREHELEIMSDQNFYSFLSLLLEREINYRLLENNPNLLIYTVKDSINASLVEYKKLLAQQKVNWIINPYRVKLSGESGSLSITVNFQVYYNPTNHLQVNTTVSVSEVDVKKTCEGNLIDCLVGEMVNRLTTIAVDRINRVR